MKGWQELIEETAEEKYDHFSFDFWSTIAFSNQQFKLERAKLLATLMSEENAEHKINTAFSNIGKKYNQDMETKGIIHNPEFLYRSVFKELEICESKLDYFQQEVEHLFRVHPPKISNGFLCFYKHITQFNSTKSITSNTAFISGDIIMEILDKNAPEIKFDFALFSDLSGCAKPSKEIYKIVKSKASALHIEQPEIQILHIGDNEFTDYEGAIKNGLNAVLIKIDN
jgi:putative hydrolase of the HAD superfamily